MVAEDSRSPRRAFCARSRPARAAARARRLLLLSHRHGPRPLSARHGRIAVLAPDAHGDLNTAENAVRQRVGNAVAHAARLRRRAGRGRRARRCAQPRPREDIAANGVGTGPRRSPPRSRGPAAPTSLWTSTRSRRTRSRRSCPSPAVSRSRLSRCSLTSEVERMSSAPVSRGSFPTSGTWSRRAA